MNSVYSILICCSKGNIDCNAGGNRGRPLYDSLIMVPVRLLTLYPLDIAAVLLVLFVDSTSYSVSHSRLIVPKLSQSLPAQRYPRTTRLSILIFTIRTVSSNAAHPTVWPRSLGQTLPIDTADSAWDHARGHGSISTEKYCCLVVVLQVEALDVSERVKPIAKEPVGAAESDARGSV